MSHCFFQKSAASPAPSRFAFSCAVVLSDRIESHTDCGWNIALLLDQFVPFRHHSLAKVACHRCPSTHSEPFTTGRRLAKHGLPGLPHAVIAAGCPQPIRAVASRPRRPPPGIPDPFPVRQQKAGGGALPRRIPPRRLKIVAASPRADGGRTSFQQGC